MIDAHDFVYLLCERPSPDSSGLPADVGDAELSAKLDAFGGELILPRAAGGVGVDVVSVYGQRRDVDARILDFIVYGRNGCIVHAIGIDAQLHAGKTFGFHEREIRLGVLAQDAELRLPIRRVGALRVRGGGRRHSGENTTSGKVHENDDNIAPRRRFD